MIFLYLVTSLLHCRKEKREVQGKIKVLATLSQDMMMLGTHTWITQGSEWLGDIYCFYSCANVSLRFLCDALLEKMILLNNINWLTCSWHCAVSYHHYQHHHLHYQHRRTGKNIKKIWTCLQLLNRVKVLDDKQCLLALSLGCWA